MLEKKMGEIRQDPKVQIFLCTALDIGVWHRASSSITSSTNTITSCPETTALKTEMAADTLCRKKWVSTGQLAKSCAPAGVGHWLCANPWHTTDGVFFLCQYREGGSCCFNSGSSEALGQQSWMYCCPGPPWSKFFFWYKENQEDWVTFCGYKQLNSMKVMKLSFQGRFKPSDSEPNA